jgi:ADP-glucose pyrophosphorylase
MFEGRIEKVNINRIKPYWRNPRVNAAAVDAVAASIKEYGYNVFIVVDTKYVIIAGDTRFKALKKLGAKEITCVVADIEPAKAKEFRIADNKTSEIATWDEKLLVQELRETDLKAMGIYFQNENLDELIKLSTGTIKWNEVTQESFNNSALNELQAINNLSDKRKSDTKCVMCPECGNEFEIT